jgi:hypothetical protein
MTIDRISGRQTVRPAHASKGVRPVRPHTPGEPANRCFHNENRPVRPFARAFVRLSVDFIGSPVRPLRVALRPAKGGAPRRAPSDMAWRAAA